MKTYEEMSLSELHALEAVTEEKLAEVRGKGLAIDMTRGRPSAKQLDLGDGLLTVLTTGEDCMSESGFDCRNYGVMEGLPEAKKLMGDILGVPAENVIIGGNASLSLMFDTVSRSMTHGVCGSTPWSKLHRVKFLCPVPGYDRHFAICEYFGIEMINVPMTPEGPDMDIVEKYVSSDEEIKGIWIVPMYSNPQGYTCSDETVRRLASLKCAAKDFRIYWDNSYGIHHFYDEPENQDHVLNIFEECAKMGNEDLVYEFCSTSKVSFAGGGISAIASSQANLDDHRQYMKFQTIGYDKVNQLRHVKFFRNLAGVKKHMSRHAAIMRPKFEMVCRILSEELGGCGICSWTTPRGGYFISFNTMEGCAKNVVAMAKGAGVKLTEAGATYPYHRDPYDSNIRIAPSLLSLEDLEQATEVFVLCVRLVSLRKVIDEKKAG
ncbi:MAG: aminotransferase class I/II-fold pyridoxal phosphate-dependent enzyme [Firmicutes bacterium]|nr:aminotransferase class I/II-fold pyridoxal phosphate-dependent enzyme [Bacillota bacterium]